MRPDHARTHHLFPRLLVGVCALFAVSVSAHAGYAQLQPPVGWSVQNGQAVFKASNSAQWLSSTVRTNAALNVGGRAVQVPVAMRLAANAPRFLGAAVATLPGAAVVAGLSLAALLAEPLFEEWMGDSLRYVPGPSGGWEARQDGGNFYTGSYGSCQGNDVLLVFQCALMAQHGIGSTSLSGCRVDSAGASGYGGSCVYVPNGIRLDAYATFVQQPSSWTSVAPSTLPDYFADRPLPSGLPNRLPMPWPVDVPVVNPSPGLNPQTQPLRIPTGDPVPIPDTNPQQWRQPAVRVTPSPTPADPWRVNVEPDDSTSNDPTPLPDPQPTPDAEPVKPEPDLCEKNPDILACKKPDLDTPDGEIPRTERTVGYQAENVFGTGSCPSDISLSLHGGQHVTLSYAQTCSAITTYVRPAVIALALFGAYLIILPGGWKQS